MAKKTNTNDRPCPKCGDTGEISEFGWRKVNGKKVRQSYCKPCRSKPATGKGSGKKKGKKKAARKTAARKAVKKAPQLKSNDSRNPFEGVTIPPDVDRAALHARYTAAFPNDKAAQKGPTGRSVGFMTKKLDRRDIA